jgi:hypothetical protein
MNLRNSHTEVTQCIYKFHTLTSLSYNNKHLCGYINAQNNMYCTSFNLRQTSEVPLTFRRSMHDVPLLLHEQ